VSYCAHRPLKRYIRFVQLLIVVLLNSRISPRSVGWIAGLDLISFHRFSPFNAAGEAFSL
jgi:hypothetical protein